MKSIVIALLLLFMTSDFCLGQIEFQNHVIIDSSLDLTNAKMQYGDIDNDGDIDIISFDSQSNSNYRIVWFENIDGLGTFGEQQTLASINTGYVIDAIIADVDGDSDLDIIIANNGIYKILWFENLDGLGTYGSEQIIPQNVNLIQSIHAGDMDNDGDLDVLSSSNFPDKIAWYENMDGQGSFATEHVIITNTDFVKHIYAKDLDGDGDLDVLSASQEDDKIAWYENMNGLGSFSSENIISTSADRAQFVYSVDIDNDGDNDVFSASINDSKIAWYENMDGQGSFGGEQILSNNSIGANSINSGDIDNDGDLDIFSTAATTNGTTPEYSEISLFKNVNGTGVFEPKQVITTKADGTNQIFTVDIDNDGDLDVLSNAFRENIVFWFENINGLGDLSDQIVIGGGLVEGATSALLVDVDGDTDLDIVSTSYYNDRLSWFENLDGLGNFGFQQTIDNTLDKASFSHFSDFDNDGDIDIVSGSMSTFTGTYGGRIYWYENIDGLGSFTKHLVDYDNITNMGSIYTGDLNGDGYSDIIVTFNGGNRVVWYENQGGYFDIYEQNLNTPFSGFGITKAESSDIDNDGDLDIVVYYSHEGTGGVGIYWLENTDGNGNFILGDSLSGPFFNINAIDINDLDGDGDKDIIAAFANYDNIVWYENLDGLGNFGNQQTIFNSGNYTSNALSLKSVDLDNDGDIDIISNIGGQNQIVWYENLNGMADFGDPIIVGNNVLDNRSLFTGDINNDNKIDIISTSFVSNKIAWYENTISLNMNDFHAKTLTLYPNPTKGQLNIISKLPIDNILVYDMNMRILYSNKLSNPRNEYQVNVTNLPSGIYFIRLQNGDLITTEKFIRE